MKAVFVTLALAMSAFAQGISIVQPTSGTSQRAGDPLTVVVAKQDSLTGSTDVSIAIGLWSCATTDCDDIPQEDLGTVLYTGSYSPKLDESGEDTQDYIVRVPATTASGPARLTVAHFYILGASSIATLDYAHTTLNITASD
ncbi:hypothetical protein BN946_scf184941.g26 [Trametes cinnabarina]|uniref:Uncharacterized protein n=1 Tax=Pycnoporus cinnabarinus TaxID=5643 RepID=A0A060ST77_PYCCI|nr:hypothetical protein BN946_scf184941.g26 [Trametes cinnabarina]